MKINLLELCKPKQWKTLLTNELVSNGKYYVYGANGIIGKYTKYNHEKPTILITCRGATCGNIHLSKPYSYINGNAMSLDDLDESKCLKEYLYYFLKGIDLNNLISGTAQPQITIQSLKNVYIKIYSLDIQKKIVSILSHIDKLIENKKIEIEKCNYLIKSQFVEMFGNINDNKNDYEIKTLSEVFEFIKDGTHSTPTYTDDKINGIKFLSAKDVTKGTINWKNIKYIPLELHEQLVKRVKPQKDDILLAKNGTTGVCAKVDIDDVFDIYVSLALLRPKEGVSTDYLVHAINNDVTKEQFDRSLKGVGVPNLHLGEIKNVKIIVPPIELQNKFVNIVEENDKQKFIIEKIEKIVNKKIIYKM